MEDANTIRRRSSPRLSTHVKHQSGAGTIEEIREGDVVRIPPGLKHWHGATATTGLTHIALQEELDDRAVEWMEKVSDEQYRAGSK